MEVFLFHRHCTILILRPIIIFHLVLLVYSGGEAIMGISKLILNGVTQMDLTSNTVASNNLLSGYIATGADGEKFTGSYVNSGTSELDAYLTRSITSFDSPVSYIGSCAFYGCSLLTSVNALQCTSINMLAFQNCFVLSNISFPECTVIGD